MPIDKASVNAFISDVNHLILPKLKDRRFRNTQILNCRYRQAEFAWNKGQSHVGALNEIVNEITIACEFLSLKDCATLDYEPTLGETDKTIDFLVTTSDGRQIYFDVKTVRPTDTDAWARFQRMQQYFTPGTHLILDQDWMGGEIAHHFIAARERFLEHTLALEAKIAEINNKENFSFALILCSDGFRWHATHLEDFADFYRTGQHRSDDHFANIESQYMEEKGLSFRGTIDSFCYFERPLPKIEPTIFKCGVHGWPIHR